MNTSELFKKIQRIQSQLTQGLVEREQTIKLTLLAALAGEHILLIGPPGMLIVKFKMEYHCGDVDL